MQLHPTNHDLAPGHIDCCQICGSKRLDLIIDLGYHAPCDSLLRSHQLNLPEVTYPLRFLRCLDCELAQIDHAVSPEELFFPDYPYRSGITETLKQNLQNGAIAFAAKLGAPAKSFVVDLGSNDGTFLQGFQKAGMNVLGVEPTNIAEIARKDGVPTVQAFFSEKVAWEIVEKHGQAKIITAANMFAHVSKLGELMRGVKALLAEDGCFVTESHYLLDLLETAQYDSIYHEHLRYYSLRSIITLFKKYGFSVVDAERIPNYGGSIRVYAKKGLDLAMSQNLTALLSNEESKGLFSSEIYEDFKQKTIRSALNLQQLVSTLRTQGHPVVAIGCPGRASTLMTYSNISKELVPYLAEQSTSLKLGWYLPGKHIPIVDEKILFETQPDYAIMLSWHYAEPIIKSLRKRGLKSKIILPLPEVRVIEN